jgi:hypothetical protein
MGLGHAILCARATLNVGFIEANLAVSLPRPDIDDEVRDAISR